MPEAQVDELAREQTAQLTENGWMLGRTWLVTLDTVAWASYNAVSVVASVEADIGDRHPLNPYVYLKRLVPSRPGESRLVWHVRGDYEQRSGSVGKVKNPLELPPTINWSTVTETVPVVAAYNARGEKAVPVVNSAGQPFDPPLTEPRTRLIATIRYNSEDFDPAEANEFQESVNLEPVTIGTMAVQERMAKIAEFSAESQEFEGIEYWAVTIKVEVNTNLTYGVVGDETEIVAQGWDREVLDQGLFELKDGATPEDPKLVIRMVTDDKEAVTEPLKLNGKGKKLDPQTANPVFLPFKTYKQKDFGDLRLEVRKPFRTLIRLGD